VSARDRPNILSSAPSNRSPSDERHIPLLVGVVGHRDLCAQELPQIRAALDAVLRQLRDANPGAPPVLLTSMADGADLLAAEVALDLGLDITCVLPYSAAQCRSDLLTDEARHLFDRAIAGARVLEVPPLVPAANQAPGDDPRDLQFQGAGTVVARYSTLLIAVWDGRENGHRAGTARVVEYRRSGMMRDSSEQLPPWNALIAAHDNDIMYEIRCSRQNAPYAEGTRPAFEVLGYSGTGVQQRDALPRMLAKVIERIADFNRDMDHFRLQIENRGHRLSLPSPYPLPEQLRYLDTMFQAVDWLGGHYHACFTWTLRLRYLLWSLMTFLLVWFKKESSGLYGMVAISGVLTVFLLGAILVGWAHRRSWHRKYLDYRALAEGLRVDFYWEIAGVHRRFDGEFAHESFLQRQDAELEWIRATMRAVSLRLAVERRGLAPGGFVQAFSGWVGDDDPVNGSGQLLYFRHRIHQLERRVRRIETIGSALLFGGLALACAFCLELILRAFGHQILPGGLRSTMLWVIALLPVYGAIFDAYVNEKAPHALIRQYRYIYSIFGIAARELRSARSDNEKLEILHALGHACLAEHAQWILAHRDKRIEGLRW
jgi:hypothetical protein